MITVWWGFERLIMFMKEVFPSNQQITRGELQLSVAPNSAHMSRALHLPNPFVNLADTSNSVQSPGTPSAVYPNLYPILSGLPGFVAMDHLYFILSVFCVGYIQCYGQNNYYFENHKYCDDLSPYFGEIDLDQITGIWYGVEKIPHTKGEYKIEHTNECFYIDIKELYIQVSCYFHK